MSEQPGAPGAPDVTPGSAPPAETGGTPPGFGGDQVQPRHRNQGRYRELRARADRTGKLIQAKAEDLRVRRQSVRTAFQTYEYDRRHGGALLAGGLAYRLFLWLLPAALFLASVAGIFLEVGTESPDDLARKAGLSASLASVVGQAARATGKAAWFLVVFGLVLMLWAGMSVWRALRLVSAVAWQVRPTSAKGLFRSSVVFCGCGVAILLSPLLFHVLQSGPLITDLLGVALVVVGLTALALWFMISLPHPDGIGWVNFLPGALLFGLGIEIMRIITAVYFVRKVGHVSLYGSLGLAAIFMAWLYLIGRIIVGGLALNATRWHERHREEPAAS